jgi:hypothetical protein
MTALTRETVEAMLAGATPGTWVASNHPGDWGLGGSWTVSVAPHDYDSTIAEIPYQTPYCLGEKQSVKDKASAAAVSAALIAAAPDLAAALLAAWDREAKLREALNNIDAIDPEAMIDGFSEHAIKGLVHCMGAIARAALGDTP